MGVASELAGGAALLGRGLAVLVRRPRLFWLGALPGLITSGLFVGLIVVLVLELDRLVGGLTPFASTWSPGAAAFVRVVVGFGIVAGSVLLMVLSFGALTLALGSPLYDRISEAVDRSYAEVPAPSSEPVLRSLGRALGQSSALIAVSAVGALVFLLVGLVPVVGAVVAAVGSAVFGGWMISIELVGSPLERRGLVTLADRRRTLRRRRWRTLGFGVPTFLLLSIPFVAVLVFPVATAGGTVLARQLRGESERPA